MYFSRHLFSIFDRLFSGVFSSLRVLCFWQFLVIFRYISLVFDWFRLFSYVFGYFRVFLSGRSYLFWVRNCTYTRNIFPSSPSFLHISHCCPYFIYISGVCGCFWVINCTISPYPTCISVPLFIFLILHISSLV